MKFLLAGFVFYALGAYAADITSSPPQSQPPEPQPVPSALPSSLPSKEIEISNTRQSTKLIPLPIYATDPNEGSTFGFLPVFIVVDKETQHTDAIYAPSLSWNEIIGTTGTMRFYGYPSATRGFTFTASYSQHTNFGTLLIWEDHPKEAGTFTDDDLIRIQRSIFFEFFGIGPDTNEGSQSNNTRLRGDFSFRRGYKITPCLNFGVSTELRRDILQSAVAPGSPSTASAFPNAPGINGATILNESLDLRYDTRDRESYSTDGFYADLKYGPTQGISNSPDFTQFLFEAKALFTETDFLQGGLRAFTSYVGSPNVPFYYQSSLGGSYVLRGYNEDRFVDQGAWEFEMEQRITLFQTHVYGVTTSWRADPFIGVGQVFDSGSNLFTEPKVAGGIGFRAYVKPNVLGRVDVAYGGEGIKFYVELGYPF